VNRSIINLLKQIFSRPLASDWTADQKRKFRRHTYFPPLLRLGKLPKIRLCGQFGPAILGSRVVRAINSCMFLSPKSTRIRVGLAMLTVVAVVTPILLGHAYGQSSQESPKLTFDVTSIHEWGPGQGPTGPFTAGLQFSAGRVRAQCVNLQGLVSNA
jgi:hypothetical protein